MAALAAVIVARLREACVDWDGLVLADQAEPRSTVTCGELRAAADEIERLLVPAPRHGAGDASGVTVKPLVWTPFFADTPFGTYRVSETPFPDGSYAWWMVGGGSGRLSSVAECKDAAQADYEARILSTLSASPAATSETLVRDWAFRTMKTAIEDLETAPPVPAPAPADGEAVARVTIEETGPVCKYFTEIDGRLQTLGLGTYDLYLATPPAARSEPAAEMVERIMDIRGRLVELRHDAAAEALGMAVACIQASTEADNG